MVIHQGCPQTPGGRIRALGFARMGARGRRRGPRTGPVSLLSLAGLIPSSLDGDSSKLPSNAGRAHPRPLESTH
jgi:hypothetical protein